MVTLLKTSTNFIVKHYLSHAVCSIKKKTFRSFDMHLKFRRVKKFESSSRSIGFQTQGAYHELDLSPGSELTPVEKRFCSSIGCLNPFDIFQ